MGTVSQRVATNLVKESAAHNLPAEKIGMLNRISCYIQKIKEFFSSLQKINRTAYYLVKNTLYAVIGGVSCGGVYKNVKSEDKKAKGNA